MGTLNKTGYQRLIDEDIEALEASNITGLEKMHIRQVLDWSVKMLYPDREVGKALERIQNRLSVELQKQKDAGKKFPTDKEIDDLIDQILKEEQQPLQTARYIGKKKEVLQIRFLRDYEMKLVATQIQIENTDCNTISWITLNNDQIAQLYHCIGSNSDADIERTSAFDNSSPELP